MPLLCSQWNVYRTHSPQLEPVIFTSREHCLARSGSRSCISNVAGRCKECFHFFLTCMSLWFFPTSTPLYANSELIKLRVLRLDSDEDLSSHTPVLRAPNRSTRLAGGLSSTTYACPGGPRLDCANPTLHQPHRFFLLHAASRSAIH